MPSVVWSRCRGRNGWDALLDVPPDMGREVLNVHFYEGGIGTKRGGSEAFTFDPASASFTGINAMFRFVPGQDETQSQLWMFSNDDPTPKILGMFGGSTAASLNGSDAVSRSDTNGFDTQYEIDGAVLNGKLYLAYNSLVNRLHVVDHDTFIVRRAGLAAPSAAPSVANTGVGSYAATLRYYKVAFTEQESSVTVRRSELSASTSFTPSGTGTAARVTRPAAPGEGETHWALFASADDTTYYRIANTVVGTTTYDDTTAPADYSGGAFEAESPAGTFVPFPSVKYLYSNGVRLFGFGVWEDTAATGEMEPVDGRVYFTPVLGSTGTHDDERISNTTEFAGWIDVARNSSSEDRGIRGLGNIIYVFQSRGIFALVPTENADVPYRRVVMSTQLGAVSQHSILAGEDHAGRPCLYFLDPELGPCRIGPAGIQWLGKDVADLWATVNLEAEHVVAHGIYYKTKGQVLWWVATGDSNDPDRMLVLDINEAHITDDADEVRGGWSTYTGTFAEARCSLMYGTTITSTAVSRQLSPYVGLAAGTTMLKGDTADETDNGTAFQAYVDSPAFGGDAVEFDKRVIKSWLVAPAQSGVSIEQSFIRASGNEDNRTASVDLTAQDGETDVRRKFEESALVDAPWFQVRLGDASAVASAWSLTRWGAKVEAGEEI